LTCFPNFSSKTNKGYGKKNEKFASGQATAAQDADFFRERDRFNMTEPVSCNFAAENQRYYSSKFWSYDFIHSHWLFRLASGSRWWCRYFSDNHPGISAITTHLS